MYRTILCQALIFNFYYFFIFIVYAVYYHCVKIITHIHIPPLPNILLSTTLSPITVLTTPTVQNIVVANIQITISVLPSYHTHPPDIHAKYHYHLVAASVSIIRCLFLHF